MRDAAGRGVTPRDVIALAFVGLVAAALVVEWWARRSGSAVSPLGRTVTAALATRTGRVLVFGAWLWTGWHFLAR
ncbi:hypothetical protein Voc01_058400 [Virgisporangium ochraceum]|uniref:Uncharacterized protein n=1 Tax=Virgisporangium ochraceum TaxID=65505 RepID=A0A8J3ZXC8_9ACTN|nr:hypothetical protein Voc01_058400 [Virgisporangium ochraceum]